MALETQLVACQALVTTNNIDASDTSNVSNKSTPSEKASRASMLKPKKKPNGVVDYDPTSALDMFVDADPKEAKGPGGAKTDPLLDIVSVMAYMKSDPGKLIVHCAGTAYGCTHTWVAPRWKTHVCKHAAGCNKLDSIDPTLCDKVHTAMVKESLGDHVESNPLLASEDGQPSAKCANEMPSSHSLELPESATPFMAVPSKPALSM